MVRARFELPTFNLQYCAKRNRQRKFLPCSRCHYAGVSFRQNFAHLSLTQTTFPRNFVHVLRKCSLALCITFAPCCITLFSENETLCFQHLNSKQGKIPKAPVVFLNHQDTNGTIKASPAEEPANSREPLAQCEEILETDLLR